MKIQIGNCTLYQANCFDVLSGMDDKSIDLILTDPPYGIDLKYSDYIDSEDNWTELMDRFIPEARRVAKMVIMPSCKIKNWNGYTKTIRPIG